MSLMLKPAMDAWSNEERRLLCSVRGPDGGMKVSTTMAEHLNFGSGKIYIFKKGEGNYAVSFSPTDPYKKGWYKTFSSLKDAINGSGLWM